MITQQPSRPLCTHCKFSLAKPNGKSKHGFQKWHKYCVDCAKALYSDRFKYLLHKTPTCEKCGFVPEDKCQMDLINKNGNKKDKSKTNLLTVCANCARLHNKQTRIQRKSILNVSVDSDIRIC